MVADDRARSRLAPLALHGLARARAGLEVRLVRSSSRWSVAALEAFWESLSGFVELGPKTFAAVLDTREMPGGHWFTGATLNYAERAGCASARIAVIDRSEDGSRRTLTYAELAEQVARARVGLRQAGVSRATASRRSCPTASRRDGVLAAPAWARCGPAAAPEFGVKSVLDRFRQIEPTVLLACDGYLYGGKRFERAAEVARDCARRCRRCAACSCWVMRTRWGRPARSRRAVERARRRSTQPLAFDGRAVRASAVDPVLVGHHGACRSRSCKAMAASCSST